jgi:hypothetical protein
MEARLVSRARIKNTHLRDYVPQRSKEIALLTKKSISNDEKEDGGVGAVHLKLGDRDTDRGETFYHKNCVIQMDSL